MLNEEKVRLMTQAATCYQKQEKEAMRINEFYKKDYVSYNVIKSVFAFSLAYLIIFILVVLYNIEWILIHAGAVSVAGLVLAAVLYIIAAVIFGIMSHRIYTNKYQSARKDIKKYQQILMKLNMFYGSEKVSVQEIKKEECL